MKTSLDQSEVAFHKLRVERQGLVDHIAKQKVKIESELEALNQKLEGNTDRM